MADSQPSLLARLKTMLIGAGFEIFRARGDEIVLAERPRENLIMDSGVRLRAADPLEVRVVFRAQKADFPNDDDAGLFDRVRRLASPALARGYSEVAATVAPVADPSDAGRTLDTFYEVTFAKRVDTSADAVAELTLALSLEKRA